MRFVKIKASNKDVYFLVDKKFSAFFLLHNWYLHRSGYMLSRFNGKNMYVHKLLLKCSSNQQIDHINRNKLDNRLKNLRIVSLAENRQNTDILKNNGSGFRGVSFNKKLNKWSAYIGGHKNRKHLGVYLTAERAAFAYNIMARNIYGKHAAINKLPRKLVSTYISNGEIKKELKGRFPTIKKIFWASGDFYC